MHRDVEHANAIKPVIPSTRATGTPARFGMQADYPALRKQVLDSREDTYHHTMTHVWTRLVVPSVAATRAPDAFHAFYRADLAQS
jgi:hypothetical protein